MYSAQILLALAATATANPILSIFARQSQNIDVTWQVSDAQFRSFENAATLKSYAQSHGVTYNIDYTKLSQVVASVDNYFDKAAASTGGTNNGGFSTGITPGSVQTSTTTTSLKGGPNYTNVTLSADRQLSQGISFSDGNAASAGGAIQQTQTASVTSSSGNSNSTATVTGGQTLNQILTQALVNGASDNRDVQGGPKDALTGGSCAALATGASASASIVTTLTIPVGTSGSVTAYSVAKSFCEAGVSARNSGKPGGSGTSSSGMQAALTDGGVIVSVTCNGRSSSGSPAINYSVNIKGSYSSASGFVGTLTGQRTSAASVSCS